MTSQLGEGIWAKNCWRTESSSHAVFLLHLALDHIWFPGVMFWPLQTCRALELAILVYLSFTSCILTHSDSHCDSGSLPLSVSLSPLVSLCQSPTSTPRSVSVLIHVFQTLPGLLACLWPCLQILLQRATEKQLFWTFLSRV